MNGINSWEILIAFLEIDCHQVLEDGVALLMVGKVDMMRCRWCWSMLVGNGSNLRKSKVGTSTMEGKLVTMINISCFWDGGKGRWGRCFINTHFSSRVIRTSCVLFS